MLSRTIIYAPDPAKGWRPWGLAVPVLAFVFVLVSGAPLEFALEHAGLLDAQENPVGLLGFAAFLLLPFGALGLLVLAWVRFVERRPPATIGLTRGHRAGTFILGHLTGVGMAAAIVAGMWAAGALHAGGFAPAFRTPAALGSIAILLACFAVQSSVEELTFRGWMLSAVAAKFGVVIAVVLSSALFTFLHHDPEAGWVFVLNVVLFAVFACSWALGSGNIWGVMGWHAGWNWLFATGFELRVTGLDAHLPALLVQMVPHGPDYLTGGKQGPEGSVLCTLVLLAGIAVTLARARRRTASQRPATA